MSASLDVVFQRRATRDIEEINTWWRANRSAAPDLFLLELRATLSIAALSPTLGPNNHDRVRGRLAF
jgi:plasmid stabilization system protein ParE